MDRITDNLTGFIIIIVVCVLVLFIGVVKKKSELFMNVILRTVLGLISIYFMNEVLDWQQIDVAVGLNPLTALTSGILGFPGVLLLYGIQFYKFL
ncbi:MAG: pro-sigmaK processing inhibitor BofA family protein [Lachnospiraceae bacterium]|nr:pro-sigmaK processing inhibitor BofA family protein [Lachnospiraceae bacterium]